MTVIYLDYNCFQRGFDDLQQFRIRMEALACQEIFANAENGKLELAWSFMHEDETYLCPLPERKEAVWKLAELCKIRIGPHEDIRELAKSYQERSNISAKDSVHIACAIYAEAEVFLTCDDRLIKQAQHLSLHIKVANPIEYVRWERE